MAEALQAHLVHLPPPQLARIAEVVLGQPSSASPEQTALAVARLLLDPTWIESTLQKLGPGARAALGAVASAGVPVLRKDLSALVADRNVDPVDQLEECGLITAVRTGRGMPTHVALPPGLEHLVSERLHADEPTAGAGATFTGHRRRFELALMLAIVTRYPPRLAKSGRLHASDLKRLERHLNPLGLQSAEIERRLSRWSDVRIVREQDGILEANPLAFADVGSLFVLLALSELATPSMPEGALRIVERLTRSGGAIELRAALEVAQAELLRARSEEAEGPLRGARTELLEVARSLVSLDALVLQDADGHPLPAQALEAVAAGAPPCLAMEPSVAAALRSEDEPQESFHRGHVQSSFEIVADSGCDPTLVARIAVWCELVRADRAVVLRLERESVARAATLGFQLETLLSDLEALASRPPPPNVVVVLKDWTRSIQPAPTQAATPLLDWEQVAGAARRAVLRSD